MMVIADTSPINYLILIHQIDLLPAMFGRIHVPEAVYGELTQDGAPPEVRKWVVDTPPWLEISRAPRIKSPRVDLLDRGEREAIQLAMHLAVGSILIDDAEGRQAAESLGLEVVGTLAVLERSARAGRCDFLQALDQLSRTSFRVSRAVRAAFVARNS